MSDQQSFSSLDIEIDLKINLGLLFIMILYKKEQVLSSGVDFLESINK